MGWGAVEGPGAGVDVGTAVPDSDGAMGTTGVVAWGVGAAKVAECSWTG